MGNRSGIFVFLRPAQHGAKDRIGRPGTREKEIGFERRGSMGESCAGSNPALYLGKSYNLPPLSSFFFLLQKWNLDP